jgi:biotin synthase-related radical SAM superfamily protein
MTYKEGKCMANCGFCPQARGSKSNPELLSRVSWPVFSTESVISAVGEAAVQGKIKRICIQALNYPTVFSNLEVLVRKIKKQAAIPVSVSCQPVDAAHIELLAKAGVNRLGIALDASTESLFEKVKGKDAGSSYTWINQFTMLARAIAVFGKGNVSTHIIIGLGETEKEAVQLLQRCVGMTILPALFAFTPIRGTALEKNFPPALESYRRVQLARYLIVEGLTRTEQMRFDDEDNIASFGSPKVTLNSVIESGESFRTSGCPDCNRPFYNEKASGPIYNYPRILTELEIEEIKRQFSSYLS